MLTPSCKNEVEPLTVAILVGLESQATTHLDR